MITDKWHFPRSIKYLCCKQSFSIRRRSLITFQCRFTTQPLSEPCRLRARLYSVLPGTVELIVTRVAVRVPVSVATGMLGGPTFRESVVVHTYTLSVNVPVR
jgi:hypothetical protein